MASYYPLENREELVLCRRQNGENAESYVGESPDREENSRAPLNGVHGCVKEGSKK